MKTILLVLFSFVFCFGIGQNNIKEDLILLNNYYETLKEFSVEVEMTYWSNKGQQLFVQKGKVINGRSVHYSSFAGRVALYKKDEALFVDDEQKLIFYRSMDEKYVNGKPELDSKAFIDSLWSQQVGLNAQYIDAPKGQKRIYVEDNLSKDFLAYSITIESKTGRLLGFDYTLRDSPSQNIAEIRIRYFNETKKPNLKEEFLNINYYLKSSGKTLTPNKNFQDYKIIDQREIILE